MRDAACTCAVRCAEPHVVAETLEDVRALWGADSALALAVECGHTTVPIDCSRRFVYRPIPKEWLR